MNNVKVHGRDFTFPITPAIKEILHRRIGNRKSGKVFTYKSTESLKFWSRMMDKLGIEHFGMHSTRKTMITDNLAAGTSISELALITNTDPRTLQKHYNAPEIRKIGDKLISYKKSSSKSSSSKKTA
jgi:integrase